MGFCFVLFLLNQSEQIFCSQAAVVIIKLKDCSFTTSGRIADGSVCTPAVCAALSWR